MKEFSIREREVVRIIGRKKTTIAEITEELFKNESYPLDGRVAVANCISRVIKKCSYHKLPWTLTKTRENYKLYIKKEKVL